MYDWSLKLEGIINQELMFQLLLKGCTIEATNPFQLYPLYLTFQLLLKGCTIEAISSRPFPSGLGFSCCWKDVRLKLATDFGDDAPETCFSCCWKDVRLKPRRRAYCFRRRKVSVVVERMYDWSKPKRGESLAWNRFQLLLKGCTIEALMVSNQCTLA